MKCKVSLGCLVGAGAMALGLCSGGAAAADKAFVLTSKTFKDGTLMPTKVSNDTKSNPNCVGKNVSPQFTWRNAPAGTVSYALTMVDPEGRGGLGVFHWVAYGIPASVTSFKEGETTKLSDKYVGGKSTQGIGSYSGPCPPPGSPHHYTFVIIATDLDPKALPPGLTYPELMDKLQGHVKGAAGTVGLFGHP